jgi:hypothetical protein
VRERVVTRRSWTLEAARELVGEVRKRTERAVTECDELMEQREAHAAESEEAEALEARIQDVVGTWAREMEALGLEAKGAWLVDFDNGSGYYCWKWPETALEWFHGYEEGFAGRIRIH